VPRGRSRLQFYLLQLRNIRRRERP
jgi:hypothetical protein